MALALPGTVAAPHFDRTAFKAARSYVTLASDGLSANFKFAPDEQEFKCLLAPEIFAPVPGGCRAVRGKPWVNRFVAAACPVFCGFPCYFLVVETQKKGTGHAVFS